MPVNVDHIDLVGHIDFAHVHIIQHFFDAFRPNLIIAGVTEETNTDHDITFQRQPLLLFHKSVFEAGTAAESDDFVLPDRAIPPLSCAYPAPPSAQIPGYSVRAIWQYQNAHLH